MGSDSKPIVWLSGEIKTPPFGSRARLTAGVLLRRLQDGEQLEMPHSRPMPSIDPRCHELRVADAGRSWRVVYAVEPDAIVILSVFSKESRKTPAKVLRSCRARLKRYRSL